MRTEVSQSPVGFLSTINSGNKRCSAVAGNSFGFQKISAIDREIASASGLVAVSVSTVMSSGNARIHWIKSTRPMVVLPVVRGSRCSRFLMRCCSAMPRPGFLGKYKSAIGWWMRRIKPLNPLPSTSARKK